MSVKEKLKAIRPMRHELELLRQQERLMFSPPPIIYDKIRVQTSPQDRMFETVQAIQELSETIKRKEQKLAEMQLEAVTLIYSLEKAEHRKLLILYYLDGDRPKKWEEVAEIMGYSESRVKHMHGWALAEIERGIKDSTKKHSHPC